MLWHNLKWQKMSLANVVFLPSEIGTIWDLNTFRARIINNHKSKESENLGQCGRQNMLRPYLKIWEW